MVRGGIGCKHGVSILYQPLHHYNAMEEQQATGVDTATSNNFIWFFVVVVLVLAVFLRKVSAVLLLLAHRPYAVSIQFAVKAQLRRRIFSINLKNN